VVPLELVYAIYLSRHFRFYIRSCYIFLQTTVQEVFTPLCLAWVYDDPDNYLTWVYDDPDVPDD
jgi:hypothetical protein